MSRSIVMSGDLADELGRVALQSMVDGVAKDIHASVLLTISGPSKHHAGAAFIGERPAPKPVWLVRLSVAPRESWMLQGRMGKLHDGANYNIVGQSHTFPTRDAALQWLSTEPATKWELRT